MKPYRPDVMTFQSENKKQVLSIPIMGQPELKTHKVKITWPELGEYKHPNTVLFFEEADQIVLLGGLGDPGSSLGQIGIFNLEGTLLKSLNAKDLIPGLEDMALKYGQVGNFPWISGIKKETDSLLIDVCEQKSISVDLKNLKAELLKERPPLSDENKRDTRKGGPAKPSTEKPPTKPAAKSGFWSKIKKLFGA